MLEGLITSKTRVKLLMRFFLNPESIAYLRELAAEFGVSPNGIREELRHLEQAHLLLSEKKGRQVHFRANRSHPLFPDLRTIVHKALGINRILDSILNRLGHLDAAYLIDDYALGRDTGVIDILLVGEIDPIMGFFPMCIVFIQCHKITKIIGDNTTSLLNCKRKLCRIIRLIHLCLMRTDNIIPIFS